MQRESGAACATFARPSTAYRWERLTAVTFGSTLVQFLSPQTLKRRCLWEHWSCCSRVWCLCFFGWVLNPLLYHCTVSAQAALPSVPADTKLSKLDVLLLAADYIAHLTHTLQQEGVLAEDTITSCPGGNLHPVKVKSWLVPDVLLWYLCLWLMLCFGRWWSSEEITKSECSLSNLPSGVTRRSLCWPFQTSACSHTAW